MKPSYLDSPLFLRDLGREPIDIVRGEGAYLYDSAGVRYLDAASGAAVASLGHGNEELAGVLADQARRLAFAHPSKFATRESLELAEKLVARAPAGLTRVLFASGGSEATETAIKLARQYHLARGNPGKYKVITRRTSYHGATLGALALSGQVGRRQPFTPMMLAQPMIAPTSCYRCPFGREPTSCDFECADDLETALLNEGSENVAAFIAEPIVGSSAPGRHPPDDYWTRIREICDRYDIVFIADEVMSGNGRSGRWWAMQHTGVAPDMITTAKGISAGYSPLAAVLVRDEFLTALKGTAGFFRHGHTFAGNPLSCAVGSRVIDIIEREGLLERVAQLGELLKRKLEEALGAHPHVGVIRGRGLLLGVEFVADRGSREPFPAELDFRTRYSHACLAEGVYVYQGGGNVDGRRGDHVLLAPPFILSDQHVDELVGGMARALERTEAGVAA
jgi:adenosylmethionine-8-amino-7-oxononanoate aminotransferase